MRRAFAILYLLTSILGFSRSARATTNPTLFFNFEDFTMQVVGNQPVLLTPTGIGVSGNSIIPLDRLSFTNDSSGNLYITNIVPQRYKVEFTGFYKITPFYIDVPSTNGIVNAAGIKVVTPVPPSTYDTTTANLRFAARGTNIASASAGQALLIDGPSGNSYYGTVSGGPGGGISVATSDPSLTAVTNGPGTLISLSATSLSNAIAAFILSTGVNGTNNDNAISNALRTFANSVGASSTNLSAIVSNAVVAITVGTNAYDGNQFTFDTVLHILTGLAITNLTAAASTANATGLTVGVNASPVSDPFQVKFGAVKKFWMDATTALNGNGGGLTNLDGTKIQAGTINSNSLDTLTKAQLALAGAGGGAATNVVGQTNIVVTASGGSNFVSLVASPVVTNLSLTSALLSTATNAGSTVFGRAFDATFPFNVNESANFNLPSAVYGNTGPILTVDSVGVHRAGFTALQGQYPQLAYAGGGAVLNIGSWDVSDLLNVNSSAHYTNHATFLANGDMTNNANVGIASNLTVKGSITAATITSPSLWTNMSPAGGNNALVDMFTANNYASGQPGYSSFSDGSGALWLSGGLSSGTNTWGKTVDFYGGIRANGNPYWYDIPKAPYGIQGVYQGFGPTKSSFAATWPSGFAGTANQTWFEVVNAAAYGGIAGIISRVGHTNAASGTLVGTNADGVKIYINQFGFMMSEFSDSYMPHGTTLGRISQQGPSYTMLGNDPTRNMYFSFNGARPGDTYTGQLVLLALSPTNLGTAFRSGNASWSGFPLQLPDTYIPSQNTFKWALASDENSGDWQAQNGLGTISNLLALGYAHVTGNQTNDGGVTVGGLTNLGAMKMPTGAGNGKVLTSDAAGNITLQTPSGSGSAPTFDPHQFDGQPAGTNLIDGVRLTNAVNNAASVTNYNPTAGQSAGSKLSSALIKSYPATNGQAFVVSAPSLFYTNWLTLEMSDGTPALAARTNYFWGTNILNSTGFRLGTDGTLTNYGAGAMVQAPQFNATGSPGYRGDASALTAVPAGQLTGSIADARLSANVPLLNVANSFTTSNYVGGLAFTGTAISSSPTGGAGTCTTNGTGQGPAMTLTVAAGSTDNSGAITWFTGTNPQSATNYFIVSFNKTKNSTPLVFLSFTGTDTATALLAPTRYFPAVISTTGWQLYGGATAVASSKTITIQYLVVGN